MTDTAINPIQSGKRVAIVDILRGWALLGVVLMNWGGFYMLGHGKTFKPDAFNAVVIQFTDIVFESKSWTMLSFLFGYGFAVLMDNTKAKGINATGFFFKRMLWLLAIAFVNCVFFFGDILKEYALLGLVLLLFRNCKAKTALWIGIALYIIVPVINWYIVSIAGHEGMGVMTQYKYLFSSHSLFDVIKFNLIVSLRGMLLNIHLLTIINAVMLGCFLIGMAAHKSGFFVHLKKNKKLLIRIWTFCLVLMLVLQGLHYLAKLPAAWEKYYSFNYFTFLSTMYFTVASICWLYLAGKLKTFFSSLQAFGKMTLTNYIVQNFLSIFIFSGFGFGIAFNHPLDACYYYLFALIIYIIQIFFSKWWLSQYYYGPIEWLWRQLSYGKRLPIKIQVKN